MAAVSFSSARVTSQVIDLNRNHEIDDDEFKEFVQTLPGSGNTISTINLAECVNLTDRTINEIIGRYSSLTDLDISKCDHIGREAVSKLLQSCPNLKSLNLRGCLGLGSCAFLPGDLAKTPYLQFLILPSGNALKTKEEIGAFKEDKVDVAQFRNKSFHAGSSKYEELESATGLEAPFTRLGVASTLAPFTAAPIEEIPIKRLHKKGVWSLTFFGGAIYSGSYDGLIFKIDPQTGTLLKKYNKQPKQVLSLCEHNGQLVSGSWDHTIRVWNSENTYNVLKGHWTGVYSICSLPKNRIASGSCQTPYQQTSAQWNYEIRIWDPSTEKNLAILKGHEGAIAELKPFGHNQLISASADHTVRIWDIDNYKLVSTLKGHKDYVYTCENIEDAYIASGSRDHSIKIWDASSSSLITSLDGHTSTVYTLKYLGNNLLASGSRDKTVYIWDLTTKKIVDSINCPSFVYRLTKAGDRTLAAGLDNGTVMIWHF